MNTFFRSAILEWRSFERNSWDQAMVLWLPLLVVALLWWTFSAGLTHKLPIAVLDQDHSSASRELTRMLDAAPGMHIALSASDAREAEQAMQSTDVYAIITIPHDFSRNIIEGKASPVLADINAQYGTYSGVIQRDVRQVVTTFSAGVQQQLITAQGMPPQNLMPAIMPLTSDSQMAFNPTTNYQSFIAATLIPALLHILATVAGAYGFGRELRDKTLRTRYYGSLGSAKHQPHNDYLGMMFALHGKLFWPMIGYTIWGAFSLSLISEHSTISPIAWWLCFLAYYLLISISLWLGVLLAATPISLRMGLSSAALITAPAYAFSGMTFPLPMMPEGAQNIANALPLTHYLHIQVMLLEQGSPWQAVLPILAGLIIASIVLMLLSIAMCYRALGHPERWGGR
ncbi:ABC transporter permease [Suttonella sp. R2A3]|uniref:ABC transporter permease n=1 Tax=Suttonella sp. R2A3 TaxID=2908648 RepID=UPI001F36004A|nr:ABC transporter permease [Suttonella sp. R2A3]UJF24076.1 ABC transporter permease [Suttonella sp. R2A3]